MRKARYNILITGVGGQGNILLSRIITAAAILESLHVRIGETFGASQRGGSVTSHVKIGEEVYSPLVPEGCADIVLGLEPLETLRTALKYANTKTLIITNTRPIYSGISGYPAVQDIVGALNKIVEKCHAFDATNAVQERVGSARALNTFMLGCLHGYDILPISTESFMEAIKLNISQRYIDLNIKAFLEGIKVVKELLR